MEPQKPTEEVKTSDKYPLYVNLVEDSRLGALSGKIGLTFAPGKTQMICMTGCHWKRSIDKDLATLKDKYGCKVLVSLIQEFEFVNVKIPTLRTDAEKLGIHSVWYPIPDGGVPKSPEHVDPLVKEIVEYIRAGDVVVIHCMGGLGRTGLVAACCLVYIGLAVKEAIKAVRKARKGTVELRVQEEFVAEYERYRAKLAGLDAEKLLH